MIITPRLVNQTTAGALKSLQCSGTLACKVEAIATRLFPGGEVLQDSPRDHNGKCSFIVALDGRIRKVKCSLDESGSARDVTVKDLPIYSH